MWYLVAFWAGFIFGVVSLAIILANGSKPRYDLE